MTLRISKDTQLCISMSARPSNIGTRFHNYLYEALGLDFVYKAFAPSDIESAVAGIRSLGIRGAAVSMPFKQQVIPFLDEVDETAAVINAVNTIVNDDGYLTGFNTDFIAVRALLAHRRLDPDSTIAVLGSGGMARAVIAAVADLGYRNRFVVARNIERGEEMAEQYDANFMTELANVKPDVIINATPVGMAGGVDAHRLPLDVSLIPGARLVFDVVAVPAETLLIQTARVSRVPVVVGTEVMTLQAVEQFELYTGVRPAAELVAQAAEFSRAE